MKHILLFVFFLFTMNMTVTAQLGIGGAGEATSSLMDQDPESVNVKVFPNPASNFIGLSHTKGVERISIFNVVGRKMKDFYVSPDTKYNIADLPNGMYLVQLVSANNKVIKTHRLTKR